MNIDWEIIRPAVLSDLFFGNYLFLLLILKIKCVEKRVMLVGGVCRIFCKDFLKLQLHLIFLIF